jgi:hypothetical protein
MTMGSRRAFPTRDDPGQSWTKKLAASIQFHDLQNPIRCVAVASILRACPGKYCELNDRVHKFQGILVLATRAGIARLILLEHC